MKEKNIDLQKRYYVFIYNQYYPGGGLEDVKATFADVEEAIKFAENADDDGKYAVVDVFDKQLGAFIEIKK